MEITSIELKQKIKSGDKILVDFYGTWCGPCKIMKPFFEKSIEVLKEENSQTQLYFFNIDTDKEFVVNEIGIRSVPTIKGFADGEEVLHSTGVLRTEQIIELAKSL